MEIRALDIVVNPSATDPIPAGNGEATIFDTTKVRNGKYNPEADPVTGILPVSGTYLNSCMDIRSAVIALLVTVQPVTFKLYWWIGAAWVLVNGAGKAVVAGTPLAEVVPFGGAGTKLTYLAGATPPTAVSVHVRLRSDSVQPVVTSV